MPTMPSDNEFYQARKVLILALTKHDADAAQNPYDKLALLLKHGCEGFENMSDIRRVMEARNRGLHTQPEVAKAIDLLTRY